MPHFTNTNAGKRNHVDRAASHMRRCWLTLLAVPVIVLWVHAPLAAAEVIAFVSEAAGEAVITHVDDTAERAVVGSQLFAGDKLKVARGVTVLVYLSGQTEKIGPGPVHVVSAAESAASPLIARLSTALKEMSATSDQADAPTVHGMARDLGITGAAPADTKLLTGDFAFTWEALAGIDEYIITVSPAGGGARTQSATVRGTTLQASRLSLVAGQRYTWTVTGKGALVGGSSRSMWLEIASAGELDSIGKSLKHIASNSDGPTAALLTATLYYDHGFFRAAQRALESMAQTPGMKLAARRLLRSVEARMQPPPPVPQKPD